MSILQHAVKAGVSIPELEAWRNGYHTRRVAHNTFGLGTITGTSYTGHDDYKLTISFDDGQERIIVLGSGTLASTNERRKAA